MEPFSTDQSTVMEMDEENEDMWVADEDFQEVPVCMLQVIQVFKLGICTVGINVE